MASSDLSDFLGYLRDHEGATVKIELGVAATDLANHDLQYAKLQGILGSWRMVDDADRSERGVVWVPVGPQASSSVGFYVEGDRAREIIVNHLGTKVRFADGHYVALVPLA